MIQRITKLFLIIIFLGFKPLFAQCVADAGSDLSICDGDGSSSNYTYLDGSGSSVPEGDVNFDWTVLTITGDGSDN